MKGYYKLLIALLQQHGFKQVRGAKGSHEIWGKGKVNTVVPFNCPSRHTANAILRQAGIDHKF
jgi:predicted RNA binding protein YcfA (HicA-like mRNA interferase family)